MQICPRQCLSKLTAQQQKQTKPVYFVLSHNSLSLCPSCWTANIILQERLDEINNLTFAINPFYDTAFAKSLHF